jgi:hypothetical protein
MPLLHQLLFRKAVMLAELLRDPPSIHTAKIWNARFRHYVDQLMDEISILRKRLQASEAHKG